MGGRVVHGQPTRLGDHDHKEGGEGEEVARVQGEQPLRPEALHDAAEVGRARPEGDGEDGEDHRRLGQGGHHHLAARAHAPEGAARVEPGEGKEERPQEQEVHHEDDVAREAEGGAGVQERDHRRDGQHDGGQDEGRRPEDPVVDPRQDPEPSSRADRAERDEEPDQDRRCE